MSLSKQICAEKSCATLWFLFVLSLCIITFFIFVLLHGSAICKHHFIFDKQTMQFLPINLIFGIDNQTQIHFSVTFGFTKQTTSLCCFSSMFGKRGFLLLPVTSDGAVISKHFARFSLLILVTIWQMLQKAIDASTKTALRNLLF